jgi:N-acetylmuramic acid 6-phosphate etherase
MAPWCDVLIAPAVGPEVVTGSTRMKAGTAQKLVLNMISTGVMLRLGRVEGNLMADMQPLCGKLEDRARRLVMSLAHVSSAAAEEALEQTDNNVRAAVEWLKSRG